MGFLSPVIRPMAISSEMERLLREQFGGGSTSSGVSVNSDTAMRLITVHNCVKVLYNCVSQTPCQLMEEVNGIKNKAKDHYLYRVLGKRPNSWMTAPEFWGLAIVCVALRGNFYAYKVKVRGEVRELIPIPPDKVQEVVQNPDYSLTYKILTTNGIIKEYPQSEIFHLRGMSVNGYTGINMIEQYAREAIGLGIASQKFLSQFFGKGMHPGVIFKHKMVLDPITHANKMEALRRKYAGLGNSWETMLVDEDMGVDFPQIRLVDAQFLELGKFNEAQICGMFGVPLMLVQAGDNPTTYASATEFKRTFVDMTLAPIFVNFESAADRDCLTSIEQDRYYAKFNLNALLRGNIVERFGAYAVGITNKFMSSNEARALEDWNPREGGDVYENPNTSTNTSST